MCFRHQPFDRAASNPDRGRSHRSVEAVEQSTADEVFAASSEEACPTPTEMGAAIEAEEPMEPTSIDSVAVVLEQARIAFRARGSSSSSGVWI